MKVNIMDDNLRQLLTSCIGVIDLGSTRGAWRGEELEGIGGLRTSIKLALVEELNNVRSDDEQVDNGEEQG